MNPKEVKQVRRERGRDDANGGNGMREQDAIRDEAFSVRGPEQNSHANQTQTEMEIVGGVLLPGVPGLAPDPRNQGRVLTRSRGMKDGQAMRKPLTPDERTLYEWLRSSLVANQCMPPLREVADYLGCKYATSAQNKLVALALKGWLEHCGERRRGVWKLAGVRVVLEEVG